METFVARQPIFDGRQQIVAYELLFRSSRENHFSFANADEATSSVIDSRLVTFGLGTLTGGLPAYINVTRNVLLSGLVELLPRENTVVELLETVEADAEVVEACARLKEAGYQLALDDFQYRPELDPLVELADIIKLDFLATTRHQRRIDAGYLRGRGVRLLAEKVEHPGHMEEASALGCDLYQGYYLARPEVLTSHDVPANPRSHAALLAQGSHETLDLQALEEVVKSDTALSYKLLRYLSALGARRAVDSIQEAFRVLGDDRLRRWIGVVARPSASDVSDRAIRTSVVRARFCELVAKEAGLDARSMDFFMMGMLSSLDTIIERPLSEVLGELSLPDDVTAALHGDGSALSLVYYLAIACERGDVSDVANLGYGLGISPSMIPQCYEDSVRWAGTAQAA